MIRYTVSGGTCVDARQTVVIFFMVNGQQAAPEAQLSGTSS